MIGVVTSPTGAVIRDILHRLRDRFPSHVVVWPVLVQGQGAASQVAAAVRGFSELEPGGPVARPDLVIVARGGTGYRTVRELVERICRKLGAKFEDSVEVVGERMGKDAAYMLDSGKLRQSLGWKDTVTLDAGLDESIAWVKKHFDELKQLPFDYIHKP